MQASFTPYGAVSVFAGDVEDDPLAGITDAKILETPNGPLLFVTTRGGGFVTAFDLGAQAGQVSTADAFAIDAGQLQLETTDLAIRDTGGGQYELYMAGLADADLQGIAMNTPTSGAVFDEAVDHALNSMDAADIAQIALWNADGGLVGLGGGGLAQIGFGTGTSVQTQTVGQGGALSGAMAADIITTTHNGHTIALVSYGDADAVSLMAMDGTGVLRHQVDVTAENGLWVDQPGAMTWVTGVRGDLYAVLASSGSGSLSVLSISADGTSVQVVDHLLDDLNTRFQNASHVTTVTMNGQDYVLAAGADQGLSLFLMLDEGRLQHVQTIAGSIGSELDGITGLTTTPTPDGARIFVITQTAPFVLEYEVTLDNPGVTRLGTGGRDTLVGGTGDDIVSGGGGDDALRAGAGNDTIQDGAGLDEMWGGSGADLFIMALDDDRDVIRDFNAGEDIIDMSALSLIGGLNNLTVTSYSWGAELDFFGSVLAVVNVNGGALGAEDFGIHNIIVGGRIAVNPTLYDPDLYGDNDPPDPDPPDPDPPPPDPPDPDPPTILPATVLPGAAPVGPVRPFEPVRVFVPDGSETMGTAGDDEIRKFGSDNRIFGDRGDDTIFAGGGIDVVSGGLGNDTLSGEYGTDTLFGGDGFDTLYGGVNDDYLSGDNHADTLYGGEGNDILVGGAGYDWLYGDEGDDFLWAGDTADRLYGGDGNDTMSAGSNFGYTVDGLWGGAGDDTMFGDAGFDLLVGGAGNDTMDGGHQADNLMGEDGDDVLFGGQGFDRLFGGAGNDLLSGGEDGDGHFGDGGDDIIWCGEGDDRAFGGAGNDTIMGDAGDDTIYGAAGFDVIVGGDGDDWLYGNFNADRFVFHESHGHDTVVDFEADNVFERLDFAQFDGLDNLADVLAVTTQVGNNVHINTGADSSVVLIGIDLDALDDDSFLF